MRGRCAWPPCGRAFTGRKGQRYCGRRCSGKACGQKGGAPAGTVARTELRDRVLAALKAGAQSEDALLAALYGDTGTASRYALRALLARGGDYFRRQGYHIQVAEVRVYRAVPGYRLKQVPA